MATTHLFIPTPYIYKCNSSLRIDLCVQTCARDRWPWLDKKKGLWSYNNNIIILATDTQIGSCFMCTVAKISLICDYGHHNNVMGSGLYSEESVKKTIAMAGHGVRKVITAYIRI